jgi:hypothetical protein
LKGSNASHVENLYAASIYRKDPLTQNPPKKEKSQSFYFTILILFLISAIIALSLTKQSIQEKEADVIRDF